MVYLRSQEKNTVKIYKLGLNLKVCLLLLEIIVKCYKGQLEFTFLKRIN